MKWTLGDIRDHFAPRFGSDGESMGDSGYGSSTGAPTGAQSGQGGNTQIGGSTNTSARGDFGGPAGGTPIGSGPAGDPYGGGGWSSHSWSGGDDGGSSASVSAPASAPAASTGGGDFFSPTPTAQQSPFGGGGGGLMTNAAAMRSDTIAGSVAAPIGAGFQGSAQQPTTPTGSQAAPTATGFNPELPEWDAPRSYDMTTGTRGTMSDLMFEPSLMQGWQNTITTQQTPDNALSPQMSITDQPGWQGTPAIDGLGQRGVSTGIAQVADPGALTTDQFSRFEQGRAPDPYGLSRAPNLRSHDPVEQVAPILDLVRSAEARSTDPYNSLVFGNRTPTHADLTGMTIAQVQDFQRGMRARGHASTAVGAYQTVAGTLSRAVNELGLNPSTTYFTPEVQDQIAAHLATTTRGFDSFQRGAITSDQFAQNLAQEWAGLPVTQDTLGHRGNVSRGQSYYAGFNQNAASIAPEAIEAAIAEARGIQAGPPSVSFAMAPTPPSSSLAAAAREQVGQPAQVASRTEVDIDLYLADVPTPPSRAADMPGYDAAFASMMAPEPLGQQSGLLSSTSPTALEFAALNQGLVAPGRDPNAPAFNVPEQRGPSGQPIADALGALNAPELAPFAMEPTGRGFQGAISTLPGGGVSLADALDPEAVGAQTAFAPGATPAGTRDAGAVARDMAAFQSLSPAQQAQQAQPAPTAGQFNAFEQQPELAPQQAQPTQVADQPRSVTTRDIGPGQVFDIPAAPTGRDTPPSPAPTITTAAGTNIPVPPARPDPRGAEVDKQNLPLDPEDIDTAAWSPQVNPETGQLVQQAPMVQQGLNIAGGVLGGQMGAVIGSVAGPIGAVAGGLLGSWAGGQIGNFSPAAPGRRDDQMGGEGDSPQQPIRRPQETAAAQAPAERVSERYLLPMFDRPDPQGRRMTPYERFIADRNNYGRSLEG